jgi:hypothetical protein
MTELLNAVLHAHGGLDRWRRFSRLRASIVSGGELWGIKGLMQDPEPRQMTVALHREWASVQPFGSADQKTDFTRDRIAIENLDGRVVLERTEPRESFAGHDLNTPWDALHRAYFNGYALWTYLTTPFLLALPGFVVSEIEPIEENGERGPGYRRASRQRSQATAPCRSSTSAKTICCAATTTASTWQEVSRLPNTSTTWWRQTVSRCRQPDGHTAATLTADQTSTS